MVSQQRNNDSLAGPPTASVAQNGSMSQANLNNIVRPIISLWLFKWKPYASYVVVQNSICFDLCELFFNEFFIICLQTLHQVWLPHSEQAGIVIS